MLLEWRRDKAGNYLLFVVGCSIYYSGSYHVSGGSESSLNIVALQRRRYYQLGMRIINLEEEISHLCGKRCRVLPMIILNPTVIRVRE